MLVGLQMISVQGRAYKLVSCYVLCYSCYTDHCSHSFEDAPPATDDDLTQPPPSSPPWITVEVELENLSGVYIAVAVSSVVSIIWLILCIVAVRCCLARQRAKLLRGGTAPSTAPGAPGMPPIPQPMVATVPQPAIAMVPMGTACEPGYPTSAQPPVVVDGYAIVATPAVSAAEAQAQRRGSALFGWNADTTALAKEGPGRKSERRSRDPQVPALDKANLGDDQPPGPGSPVRV